MKKYFGKFASSGDVQTALQTEELNKPYVALVEGDGLDYNGQYVDYNSMYLTLQIISAGTLSWSFNGKNIQYSKNEGEWSNVNQGSDWSIDVVAGDTVRLKGTNASYYKQYGTVNRFSSSTSKFKAYGNVLSLIYGDNFATATTVGDNALISLFRNCYSLVDAKNMVFPATTLGSQCYLAFFEGCSGLIDGPTILPATTLSNNCYESFYYHCYNLTGSTILPATSLTSSCYSQFYNGCSSLVSVKPLPATVLASNCYGNMFENCSNLQTAPDLMATTLQSNCYNMMFSGCKKLNHIKCLASAAGNNTYKWLYQAPATGTFVKAVGSSWTTGNSGIPNGWTVIEE